MIKKLDILVYKAFIGPFLATFFISFFIFMIQIAWKYIDELIGKGIELTVIAQFLFYASASMLTYALPIAILLSSIMAFGNLSETFELVAIKSSGISLLRFMRPIFVFTILSCLFSFYLNNTIIPYANLKFYTLYRDIQNKRASLLIKDGAFLNGNYGGLNGYSIYANKKSPDGNILYDVSIFEYKQPFQDASLTAKKAELSKTPDGKYLVIDLVDGERFEENGNYGDTATNFIRLKFEKYRKIVDISNFISASKTSDSVFLEVPKNKNLKKLNYNIAQINKKIDSLQKEKNKGLGKFYLIPKISKTQYDSIEALKLGNDSGSMLIFADSIHSMIYDRALGNINELKSDINYLRSDIEIYNNNKVFLRAEWHRKFSHSLICLILFFIGAPLGSIIRKGGLGMPVLMAILFFVIYHLLNTFGDKLVRQKSIDPMLGMWLPFFILTPICIFLTYKALRDAQLFNKEFFYRLFSPIRKLSIIIFTEIWPRIKPSFWT